MSRMLQTSSMIVESNYQKKDDGRPSLEKVWKKLLLSNSRDGRKNGFRCHENVWGGRAIWNSLVYSIAGHVVNGRCSWRWRSCCFYAGDHNERSCDNRTQPWLKQSDTQFWWSIISWLQPRRLYQTTCEQKWNFIKKEEKRLGFKKRFSSYPICFQLLISWTIPPSHLGSRRKNVFVMVWTILKSRVRPPALFVIMSQYYCRAASLMKTMNWIFISLPSFYTHKKDRAFCLKFL